MNVSRLLRPFRFCPCCGSSDYTPSGVRSMRCRACGYEHFVNTSGAVAAWIVNTAGAVLVCRRRYAPAVDTLDLPGGFIEPGESAEEALFREVLEETDVRITEPEYMFSLPNMYEWKGVTIPTIDLFFRCRCPEDTSIVAGDDADECLWLSAANLNPALFGLKSVSEGVRRLKEKKEKSEE